MKKLIPLLLALVMIVGCFAACNKTPASSQNGGKETPKSTPAQTPGEGGDTPGNSNPGEQTPPEKTLNLDLENLDYGGKSFYIYHWQTSNPEFDVVEDPEAPDEARDPIDDALYKRNLYTEEGLGIKLDFHAEPGGDNQQTSFVSKLKTRLQNPDTPVDLIAAYSRTAPYVLIDGYAVDLYTYSSDLDLSKAWWPNNVRKEHEIKGRLFYTSGDASTGLLTMMEIYFLNKTMFKGLGRDYDSFMEDVKAGKWTIDMFIELTKDVGQDTDGTTGETPGDIFGLIGNTVTCSDSLWIGMGYRLFDISDDEDVIYTLSPDVTGENATNYVSKIFEWWSTKDVYISGMLGSKSLSNEEQAEVFSANHALFLSHRIGYFDAANCPIDYTILPAPKATEKQEKYYVNVGNPYSLFSICANAEDKDMVAQVLQTLGYYGYTNTTPALFDVTFKGQYAKDDYSVEMFDIIREGITFEIGRSFDRYTGTMLPNLISGCIKDGATWSSRLSANKKQIFANSLDSTNKKLFDALMLAE